MVLVKRYQRLVTSITLSILKDFGASEDAAQDAFLQAWKKIGSLKEATKWKPWLVQIARNTAIDHLRKRKRSGELEPLADSLPDQAFGPDEIACSKDDSSLVLDALGKLPEKYRTPLILYYREGQSVTAVAEGLDLSHDAVRQRLKRGRDSLRGQLEKTLGRVLVRTAPTMAFTVSVATILSGAGTTTGAAATGGIVSSVTKSNVGTSSLVAMMHSAKSSLIAVSLIGVLSFPAGYAARGLLDKGLFGPEVEQRRSNELNPNSQSRGVREIPPSRIGDEWKRLLAKHGSDSEAMLLVYEEVGTITDEALHDGLMMLLIAEWVSKDGRAGYTFLRDEKDGKWKAALLEEWLRSDSEAAIAGVQELERNWGKVLRKVQVVLAERAPEFLLEHLQEVVGRRGSGEKAAIQLLAEYNYDRLREAAVAGGMLDLLPEALRVWAREDGAAAYQWALDYSVGGENNARNTDWIESQIRANALAGWASVDSQAVLEELFQAQVKGRFSTQVDVFHFKVIMPVLVATDLEGTMSWCREHSSLNNHFYRNFMWRFIEDGLSARPREFLDTAHSQNLLGEVVEFISDVTMPHWREVAQWIRVLPEGREQDQMVVGVAQALADQDPLVAVEFVENWSQGELGAELRQQVANGLITKPSLEDVSYYRELYPEWSEELTIAALTVFGHQSPSLGAEEFDSLQEPDYWIREAKLLHPDKIPGSFFQGMMKVRPKETISWLRELDSETWHSERKESLIAHGIGGWLWENESEALSWLSQNHLGEYQDRSAIAVITQLSNRVIPLEETWPWVESIGDSSLRAEACSILSHGEEQKEEIILRIQELPITDLEKQESIELFLEKEAGE